VGRILSAEAEMRKALALDAGLVEAHYDLAQILMSMDMPDREAAAASYERAIELGGQRDEALEKALKAEPM
jgi:Tfp pilus assembly protein PilF